MDVIMEVEATNAINVLRNNKAPGPDQKPIELLKHRGTSTTATLTRLLNVCWQKECIPEEWRWGVIVKLPKEDNITDCNNWCSVTLLSL